MTKNVTVAIPADVHRQARIWAARHNTSLSSIVGYFLCNIDSFVQARRKVQNEIANSQQREQSQSPKA